MDKKQLVLVVAQVRRLGRQSLKLTYPPSRRYCHQEGRLDDKELERQIVQ